MAASAGKLYSSIDTPTTQSRDNQSITSYNLAEINMVIPTLGTANLLYSTHSIAAKGSMFIESEHYLNVQVLPPEVLITNLYLNSVIAC